MVGIAYQQGGNMGENQLPHIKERETVIKWAALCAWSA